MQSPSRALIVYLAGVRAGVAQSQLERLAGVVPDADLLVLYSGAGDAAVSRPSVTILTHEAFRDPGFCIQAGFRYALRTGHEAVVVLQGAGLEHPECIPALLGPIMDGNAAATAPAARRGMAGGILAGGPAALPSDARAYSTTALRLLPWEQNSTGDLFDAELMLQFHLAGMRIETVSLPWATRTAGTAPLAGLLIRARLHAANQIYDARFDCETVAADTRHYGLKFDFPSSHTMAYDRVPARSRVLDLGCGSGYFGAMLASNKGCVVTGVDRLPSPDLQIERFIAHDLGTGLPEVQFSAYDVVLLLDVIEHLPRPEEFAAALRRATAGNPGPQLIVSTGNIAFFVIRLLLLAGQFNYAKRGILDLTHTRLFTIRTFRRLFERAGFEIVECRGVPAPFPLALGNSAFSDGLVALNRALIRLAPSLFSYQILLQLRPRPTHEMVLEAARNASATHLQG